MPCGVASRSRTDARALRGPSIGEPDAGHDADALRLDEDLAFVVLGRADRLAEVVVGAPEPVTVPSVGVDGPDHLLRGTATGGRPPRRRALSPATHGHLVRGEHEQPGDEHRLGHPAVAVLRRLERLARRVREAVEVEAVVPVGTADERQPVRAEPFERVVDGAPQVVLEAAARYRAALS